MSWQKNYSERPERFPPETEHKVLGIYMAGGSNAVAARAAGCSIRHLQYVIDAWPEFKEMVAEAREFPKDFARMALHKMGVKTEYKRRRGKDGKYEWREEFVGNIAALIFYLKNECEYSDRREITGHLTHEHYAQLVTASFHAPLPENFQLMRLPYETEEGSEIAGLPDAGRRAGNQL